MLQITDLTYRVGPGRVLLESASATVSNGHHVGLVGRNGTGKSTLLKLISGDLQGDSGSIALPPRAKMAKLSQETPEGEGSLLAWVLAADTERESLLQEAETCTDPERIGEIHSRLEDIRAHSAPARAATILAGLGFDTAAQERSLNSFSGGWRMRVALAAILFLAPDLLLLDEPTNHLDLEATLWLEGHLQRYPGTVIMVSHDREILNSVCTHILHLEHCRLTLYSGNYDRFERTRRETLERQGKMAAKQIKERERIQSFVDRFRAKASKARQAQSRIKMLEKMEPIAAVMEDESMRFHFPQPEQLPPPIVALDNVTIGYDNRPLLRNLNQRIDQDDRIALLGQNGNGKSTFMKLLAGRLEKMAGQITKPSKLRIGYFAQHQTEELDTDGTPLTMMQRALPDATETEARSHLGRFGFQQARSETLIGALSGGEKARLLFALLTRNAPHLLLLDEPTNHLDIDAREALVQAINDYQGAVIMVSHDPHLIKLSADRLWLVADGQCQTYDGDMTDYRKFLIDSRKTSTGPIKDSTDTEVSSKKDQRREAAQKRTALAPLKKKIDQSEQKIKKLTQEKEKIEQNLADPKIYEGPAEKITNLQKTLADINQGLEKEEENWLLACENYESASQEDI